jgi:pimeloyl-ACP methyl ester carboxylesterase
MENLIDRRIFSIEEVHFEIGNAKQEALMIFQDEPAPGVVFVHGHKSNGWKSLIYGKYLHNEGYAVCLPSQRGYGFSEGESDFCGPDTLAGVQNF